MGGIGIYRDCKHQDLRKIFSVLFYVCHRAGQAQQLFESVGPPSPTDSFSLDADASQPAAKQVRTVKLHDS